MEKSLKKNRDFKNVYEKKISCATKSIVMYISKNCDMESNRLGISVSRKIGNSVVRHTLTRRAREIFYMNEKNIINGYDIIVVFRSGSYETEFSKLNEEFIYLCKKQGIWENNG